MDIELERLAMERQDAQTQTTPTIPVDATARLLRRLQLLASATVDARRLPATGSAFPRLRPFKSHRAEIRGSVLVLTKSGAEKGALPVVRAALENATLSRKDNVLRIQTSTTSVGNFGVAQKEPVVVEIKVKGGPAEALAAAVKSAATKRTVGLDDFVIISPIGRGGSGKVFLVEDKATGERLAMKVLEKAEVYESDGSMRHAIDERLLLEKCQGHPNIVQLKYAFQTEANLYLVTEFCEGGDLHMYLRRMGGKLSEAHARQIAAEVVLAVNHVHSLGVVYRDIKPENILLDSEGHIRLADFGLAKFLEGGRHGRTRSFCGTRDFIAPEMMVGGSYGLSVDTWSFGVLLYRMVFGRAPFPSKGISRAEHVRRVEEEPVRYPNGSSPEVESLLKGLLHKDLEFRMEFHEIQSHPFFAEVDWDRVAIASIDIGDEVKKMEEVFDLTRVKDMSIGESSTDSHTGRFGGIFGRGRKSSTGDIAGFSFTSEV
eukprot:CAMPEP_0198312472 /NCGR_PEP_ID=MMETSP1450-20131203/3822_1 /TAXON_ID=753684 ORGANISM="Madagascaria erythrocladiodes, Strain CCMP3234" /NCGR_SAMPLE_ID=MMETSP1450 /ASSEMBLY_ACC=CAM_ASM_001115 /LENGTH=486 /DNA_ID=CAMNT_0044015417 /DNA_START=72 /DNA_END=1532 /DNA_ORIENTATION=+